MQSYSLDPDSPLCSRVLLFRESNKCQTSSNNTGAVFVLDTSTVSWTSPTAHFGASIFFFPKQVSRNSSTDYCSISICTTTAPVRRLSQHFIALTIRNYLVSSVNLFNGLFVPEEIHSAEIRMAAYAGPTLFSITWPKPAQHKLTLQENHSHPSGMTTKSFLVPCLERSLITLTFG